MKKIIAVSLLSVAFLLGGCATNKSPMSGKCASKVAKTRTHKPKYAK